MKLVTRVLLFAVLAVSAITSSQIASAAPLVSGAPRSYTTVAVPAAQGCSGTPTIQYAYANPPVISSGQVTTLQWGLVGNASAAFLQYPDGHRIGIGTPGSKQVNPTETKTYFVIGVCGSNQVQFPMTVTVQNAPGCNGSPQITSFTANPATISNGQTSTIAWGPVNNADNVQLSSSTQGSSGVPAPGSIQSRPNQTTTYYLTAWCRGNSVQQQVVVNVTNPPPPPPANNNAINSITVNGGLTNSSQLILSVNYFWNGEDAPAVLQGTAYNSGGQQISQSNATRINPNQTLNANLNFKVNPSQVTRANVCIIGSSGTELECKNSAP